MSSLNELPELCKHSILSFLSPNDLGAASQLNREFRVLSCENALWKIHCQKRWKGKQSISGLLRRYLNRQSDQGTNSISWKQWYLIAEHDKGRATITREEICDFSWKLIYNGTESRMGLRKFSLDGTYNSPYAGICEWTLFENRLCFMGMQLPIERDQGNWGWIIGKGFATVYVSVEDENEFRFEGLG